TGGESGKGEAGEGEAGQPAPSGSGAGGAAQPAAGGSGAGGMQAQSGNGSVEPSGNRGLGDECKAGADCLSTYCADGVCCQSQCGDSCSACNLKDNIGVCTALAAGEKPRAGHPACDTEAQSSCGKNGTCDGDGACALWNDVVCKAASCSAGTNSVSSAAKCDGKGACMAPAAISCAPYTCDAAGVACNSSCNASQPCAAPNPCVDGSCGAKPNGNTCSQDGDCTSGHCVDGYCCNGECSGKCEACDLPAAPGTCSPVTSGQPRGGRGACGGTAPCGGACGAASRSACTFPGSTVACRTQSCQGSSLTAAASCNGAGSCPSASTSACSGSLTCNSGGTACLTSCTSAGNCVSAAPYCVSGSCTAARPNGTACTANSQCQNARCVDGYCCDGACSGQCEACDVAGSAGTCTAVGSGAPHGSRAACGGSGACAGACGAGSRTACSYPGGGTECAAAGCADTSSVQPARFCDGGGGCAPAAPVACSSGSCTGGTCAATCFVAGTLVDTADGLRPIESIRAGDRVRSYDELTGQSAYRRVMERERRVASGLVRVTLSTGGTITMSPEHQLWVQESGWVRAAQLTPDDALRSAQGAAVDVEALEAIALDSNASAGVEVFNLLVEQSATYFVGSEPVLVHSCDYLNFSALDPGDTPQ
ncbi:MAG TPA: polymorphic toxin-type HINT domain-containing protein, partial [Polyangiales bacterium]|nr:polymorphic toxin-type HINT domain-containing protein [Polyangiales bacterium]